MTRYLLPLMLAGCLLGATGCLSLKKPAPEKHYYVLDVQRTGTARETPVEGAVRLDDVRISPRYDKNELTYRIGELEYETDFYNEFFISPREMIAEEALRWLGGSGLFGPVAGEGHRLGGRYDLTLAVTSLYGDYRDPAAPRAVLNMQALVVEIDNSPRRPVVFNRDYSEQVPLAGRSAEACVVGLNQALANILTRLEADLAAALGDK